MFRFICLLMTLLLFCPSSPFPRQNIDLEDSNQKKLVGQAIFPDNQYKEWLDVQNDPHIDPATKIKCTANTFFICNYETVVKAVLQDFGFLFDRKNDIGSRYYSYELGLMYSRLEGWKLWDHLLKFYEYRPKFDALAIDGSDATVKVLPRARVVHTNYPYSFSSGLYLSYTFKLKEVDGFWLIQKAEGSDEMHEIYPLGTDWISHVAEMKKSIEDWKKGREFEKSTKEPQKIKKKSPSPEELRDARKIEIYHEIFGYYNFLMNEKKLVISFFTKDTYLFGQYGDILEIPLFPVDDNFLEFEWRPESPYDKIYKLRFVRDQEGNITKCILQIGGQSYKGIKLTGPCHVYKD